jgi:hypothetical protein
MRLLEQPGEEALLPRGGEEGEEEHEQEEAGGHEGGDHQRRLQEHLQEAKTILPWSLHNASGWVSVRGLRKKKRRNIKEEEGIFKRKKEEGRAEKGKERRLIKGRSRWHWRDIEGRRRCVIYKKRKKKEKGHKKRKEDEGLKKKRRKMRGIWKEEQWGGRNKKKKREEGSVMGRTMRREK